MHFEPYLNFNGNCEEAINFYADVFGGKVEFMQRVAGSPVENQMGPDMGDKILHATVRVGDAAAFMACDSPPDRYEKPSGGNYVSIGIDDPAEADRIWGQISVGGEIVMPIDTTFWAERFGMVVDRFGTPWMINCQGNVEFGG